VKSFVATGLWWITGFNFKESFNSQAVHVNPAGTETDAFLEDQTNLIPYFPSTPTFLRY
jgi:hypothetical protein